jgi:hypothetical protein
MALFWDVTPFSYVDRNEQFRRNTNIIFLDIIHRPVFISNKTFCRLGSLQVKLTQLSPIDRASPYHWR